MWRSACIIRNMAKIINIKQVEKVGELSKLNLTESEKTKLLELFIETLNYVDVLDELDLKKVVETYQVTGLVNVFLQDGMNVTLTQDEVLLNAKEVVKGLFATTQVLER